jgi:hypothetical protein
MWQDVPEGSSRAEASQEQRLEMWQDVPEGSSRADLRKYSHS